MRRHLIGAVLVLVAAFGGVRGVVQHLPGMPSALAKGGRLLASDAAAAIGEGGASLTTLSDDFSRRLAVVRARMPDFTIASVANTAVPLDDEVKEAVRVALKKIKEIEAIKKANSGRVPDGLGGAARLGRDEVELTRAYIVRAKTMKAQKGGARAAPVKGARDGNGAATRERIARKVA